MPSSAGIHYLEHASDASGTPLVLVHGAGGTALTWPLLFRQFPKHRVISIDLPGHGQSTRVSRQTVLAYAQDLLDFLYEMHLPRVVLIGHSLGGAICLQAALLAPARVQALTALSTAAACELPEEIYQCLADPAMRERVVQFLCNRLASPFTTAASLAGIRRGLLAQRVSLLYGDLRTCQGYDLSRDVMGLDVPALVCSGSWDLFIRQAASRQLAELLPATSFVSFEAGHLLPLERPREVTAAIRSFLEHPPAGQD